ncbi:DUF4244 domain-containing protein [Intrasporangium sp.]|uniref:DUF4244 domain-containing protein n=1 Tax=Intrasporangium sp. TaxID=1925024 RepID=UPI003221F77D
MQRLLRIRHLVTAGQRRLAELGRDRGMTTAEYAVGIMAACTFALVLLGVVRSDAVRSALTGIVQNALGLAG